MFRKGSLQDADMVQVYNTASKWEADIAKKLLEEAGIAALVMDREDSGAAYHRTGKSFWNGRLCKQDVRSAGKAADQRGIFPERGSFRPGT